MAARVHLTTPFAAHSTGDRSCTTQVPPTWPGRPRRAGWPPSSVFGATPGCATPTPAASGPVHVRPPCRGRGVEPGVDRLVLPASRSLVAWRGPGSTHGSSGSRRRPGTGRRSPSSGSASGPNGEPRAPRAVHVPRAEPGQRVLVPSAWQCWCTAWSPSTSGWPSPASSIVHGGKLWYLDRMVLLFEDMKQRNSTSPAGSTGRDPRTVGAQPDARHQPRRQRDVPCRRDRRPRPRGRSFRLPPARMRSVASRRSVRPATESTPTPRIPAHRGGWCCGSGTRVTRHRPLRRPSTCLHHGCPSPNNWASTSAGCHGHAFDGAPAADRRSPVLLLSPSGFSPLLLGSLAEELASHGYVVVGVNHTFETAVTVFATAASSG